MTSERYEKPLVDLMAKIQTESRFKKKSHEVSEGIKLFLEIARLKKKGVLKNDFWGVELDTPTTIIEILSSLYLDSLLEKTDYHEDVFFKALNTGKNVLCKCGEYWLIKYNDETKICKDRKRLAYLIHLIENQGESIETERISVAVNKPNTQMDKKRMPEEEGLGLMSGRYQENDRDTCKKIEDYAQQLFDKWVISEDEKDESNWNNFKDVVSYEYSIALFEKKGKIILKEYSRLKDDYEKTRKNIRKNLKNAINDFKHIFPALCEHLKASISTGGKCSYSPNPSIKWNIIYS
jgi:hypothetical protein